MTVSIVPNEDPIRHPTVLVLELTQLPAAAVRGIYTVKGVTDRMPDRALFLAPDAAASFLLFADDIRVSDIFRSPESSLAAVKAGRGARLPGYSGHNYGLSVDLDLDWTQKHLGLKKPALDTWMGERGWFCHRRDGKLDFEAWHYNFLGVGTVISPKFDTTSGYVEAEIVHRYGGAFELDIQGAQAALKRLRLYSGEVDGLYGPLTRTALEIFQRAWNLITNGKLDRKTCRTLAYVAAERHVTVA